MREYSGQTLVGDLVAAAIVSMMLIPQSLAYALLVGLPPQLGLYASMAPLLLYAVFGTSRALAVGPVAVASLMTGAAAAQVATQGTPEHLGAAVAIALLTGLLMIAMGFLRLGFLANFLSHPVVSGFITAAAVQIAAGQIGPLLGIKTHGESLLEILESLLPHLGDVKPVTAAIGIAAVVFLLWAKRGLKPLMVRFGLGDRPADIVAKAAPAMAIVACTAAVWAIGLDARGVGILGDGARRPAEAGAAAVRRDAVDDAAGALAAHRHRRLRGVDLGRAHAGRQAPPARRPGPGTHRAGRGRHRLGRLRRLSRHRRAVALGGELRGRRPDAGRGRIRGDRRGARDAVPHAAALLHAEDGARRHHHRRGAVPRGLRAR